MIKWRWIYKLMKLEFWALKGKETPNYTIYNIIKFMLLTKSQFIYIFFYIYFLYEIRLKRNLPCLQVIMEIQSFLTFPSFLLTLHPHPSLLYPSLSLLPPQPLKRPNNKIEEEVWEGVRRWWNQWKMWSSFGSGIWRAFHPQEDPF